ncbi:transposase, partial [Acinetobacter baumannii]|nr:transposase [Acinetobacter baumannii]
AKIDAKANPHTLAMRSKMQTPLAKAAYRRRKAIVEAPNAWIKHVLGFRSFSLRGLQKVKAEWKLVCAALNLRRMGQF